MLVLGQTVQLCCRSLVLRGGWKSLPKPLLTIVMIVSTHIPCSWGSYLGPTLVLKSLIVWQGNFGFTNVSKSFLQQMLKEAPNVQGCLAHAARDHQGKVEMSVPAISCGGRGCSCLQRRTGISYHTEQTQFYQAKDEVGSKEIRSLKHLVYCLHYSDSLNRCQAFG